MERDCSRRGQLESLSGKSFRSSYVCVRVLFRYRFSLSSFLREPYGVVRV